MPRDPYIYRETAAHGSKVVARVTADQLRTLHAIAQRHRCVCADGIRRQPVWSPRALVQAIADGRLVVVAAPAARGGNHAG